MGVLDSLESTSKDALTSGEQFLESSKKYYELRVFKQLALATNAMMKMVVIGSFCLLGILFATVALALFLGNYLQNSVQGFLLTAVILFTIGFLFYLGRKKMERKVLQKLSETFFDKV